MEPTMKSFSKRAMLMAALGMSALTLNNLPLGQRINMGLGFQRGDQFYKHLPFKRVKGKWTVKK